MLQNLLVMYIWYICDPVAIQSLNTFTQLFSEEVSSWSWHCTQTCSILIFSFLSQSAEMKMLLPQPVDAYVQEQGSSS